MSCELTHQYLHELMTAAEQFFGFSHEQMITKKVVRADTIIRHLVFKYFAEQLRLSSDTIGSMFNDRHRATVNDNIRTANDILDVDKELKTLYDEFVNYMICKGYKEPPNKLSIAKSYPISNEQIFAIRSLFDRFEYKKDFYIKYGFQHSELHSMLLKKRYSWKLKERVEKLLNDI